MPPSEGYAVLGFRTGGGNRFMTGDGWWFGASTASDVVLASWLYLAGGFSAVSEVTES